MAQSFKEYVGLRNERHVESSPFEFTVANISDYSYLCLKPKIVVGVL